MKGKKANKKKAAKNVKKHNPKAFTNSGGWKSIGRRVFRGAEIEEKRQKFSLLVDKTPEIPPPYIVVVHGPKGVGKTTLIRSLVKNATNRTLAEIIGPVTFVANKHRRLTFVECPGDINGMVDLAKVADLVLLMIDASFGWELETFEMLNIMKNHGFPSVLGILTHLDAYKDNKTLKKRKKQLKDRFWEETYDGAKLFFLSKPKGNRYHKREVLNLSRFISVQKYKPLTWQSQHPYVLPLTIEIEPDDKNRDDHKKKTVTFSGYLKGARLRENVGFHIPGAGDFELVKVTAATDPCPMPKPVIDRYGADEETEEAEKMNQELHKRGDAGKLLRKLKAKDRVLFAPHCSGGSIDVCGTQVYVSVPKHPFMFTPKIQLIDDEEKIVDSDNDKVPIIRSKAADEDDASTVDSLLASSSSEDENPPTEDEDTSSQTFSETEDTPTETEDTPNSNREKRDTLSGDMSSSEDESQLPEAVRMIRKLQKAESVLDEKVKQRDLYLIEGSIAPITRRKAPDRLIGECDQDHLDLEKAERIKVNKSQKEESDDEGITNNLVLDNVKGGFESDDDDLLMRPGQAITEELGGEGDDNDSFEPSMSYWSPLRLLLQRMDSSRKAYSSDESKKGKKCLLFRTDFGMQSGWSEGALKALKVLRCITGSWDLGAKAGEAAIENAVTRSIVKDREDDEDEEKRLETQAGVETLTPEDVHQPLETDNLKLQRLKELETSKELKETRESSFGCYNIGDFIRITIRGMSEAWVERHVMSSSSGCLSPVILGGISLNEDRLGLLHCHVKRHRWAIKSVLKSNDVLSFSVGWRRFQALPIYSMEDRNSVRQRYLKYTPETLHCHATFMGPRVPIGTGVLAFRDSDNQSKNFRLSLTGSVKALEPSQPIVKKIKLLGSPKKIMHNSAFIVKMFNSDLEVAKCIGARIQTQSGIRGQIKAAHGKSGEFRATFEDKIQPSDIVILKGWTTIKPSTFYNPILDLPDWRALRTQNEIRREYKVPVPYKAESEYGQRPETVEVPVSKLKIGKTVLEKLPYSSLPKNESTKMKSEKELDSLMKPEMSLYERQVAALLGRLNAIKKDKVARKQEALSIKMKAKEIAEAKANAKREMHNKENRKQRHIKQGLQEVREQKRQRIRD